MEGSKRKDTTNSSTIIMVRSYDEATSLPHLPDEDLMNE
jgi:hypothetical protein